MCRIGSLLYDGSVRVGLVSPYSYTYPGGVGRHVEALAEELLARGHEVRLLAPYDPDDRLARVMHRGAAPDSRPLPDYLVPLGRTVGIPSNGSVSNLSVSSQAVGTLGRELRNGGYDVVHVHEPNAPFVSWFATEAARVPLVGTFHCYSRNPLSNGIAVKLGGARRLYSKLDVRIAVSEAARWTCERFYGGRYRIVPNGVDLAAAVPAHHRPGDGRSSCSSSAARRRARACRSCCAPSRRCAPRAWTPGSRWPAPPRRRSRRCCSTPRACGWPVA